MSNSAELAEEVSSNFTCTVCLELFVEPTILRCGHRFCKACIMNYLNASKNNKTCPLCKNAVSKRELVEEKGLGQLLQIITKYVGPKNSGASSKKTQTINPVPPPEIAVESKGASDLEQPEASRHSTIDQNSRAISLAAGIYKPKREVGGNFIDHDDRSNTEISALSTKPTVRDIAHPRFTPGFSKIVEIPSKVSKSTTSTRTPISILNQTSNQQKDGAASDFIDPKEIRLGVSSVPMEMQGDINTFKLKFSMKNLRTYGAMTHLVVLPETDKQTKDKFVGRTFKVMMAIVHGIPIVEYRWVRDSVLSDRILDPSSYLVLRDRVSDKGIARSRGEGFKNFFNGLKFCVVRTMKHGVKFKESEVRSLLLAGGGIVSDIEDLIIKEKPRCEANEQLKEGEASKKEDSKVYFIVMVESVENLTCYQFHMSDEVLTYYWVLDSISRAEILDTAAYKLPSSS